MQKRFGMSLIIPILTLLIAIPACGAPIPLPLANAGFELQDPFNFSAGCDPGPTNCYNTTVVDWDLHGGGGTISPALGASIPILPLPLQGNNVAYLTGGYMSQDLGVLLAGTTYRVQVAVAGRDGGANNYRLGASLGSSASPTFVEFYQLVDTTPGSNLWEIATLDFTPLANANYFVYVSHDGGGSSQLFVDAAVPEPGTFLLVGLGLVAAGFLRRKF